jgi:hypothetical protein
MLAFDPQDIQRLDGAGALRCSALRDVRGSGFLNDG